MRPRRVPWKNISELEQVCDWVYREENGIEGKKLAIQRLVGWQATTVLPSALETTLSLLTAIISDPMFSDSCSTSKLAARNNYCTAIVRMVNGVVDPLQLGAYARSIASIAAQVGLPNWLVEIRHAATHEELPELELLRRATSEAMGWLFRNFFRPILSPISYTGASDAPTIPSLRPWIKRYKVLSRRLLREKSSAMNRLEATRLHKELERWISGVKIYPLEQYTVPEPSKDYATTKESYAMEQLCAAMLDTGGLVPSSERKRLASERSKQPPDVAIWSDILLNIQGRHPSFGNSLLSVICFRLSQDGYVKDSTYDASLVMWVAWIVTKMTLDRTQMRLLLARVLTQISQGEERPSPALSLAIETIVSTVDGVVKASTDILSTLRVHNAAPEWNEESIHQMSRRLDLLRRTVYLYPPTKSVPASCIGMARCEGPSEIGWRKLHRGATWQPNPLGIM